MCKFCSVIYPDDDTSDIVFGRGEYSGLDADSFITIDKEYDNEEVYHINVNPGDPYEIGCIPYIKFCPYCGRKLGKEEKQNSDWIPVSKELPEKDIWVLVYCKEGEYWHGYPDVMKISKYNGSWTDGIDYFPDRVIAWMPLPEPYTAKLFNVPTQKKKGAIRDDILY